jgi:hypothetical protein
MIVIPPFVGILAYALLRLLTKKDEGVDRAAEKFDLR